MKNKIILVRLRGLEPPRDCSHTALNRARLPIPPQPHSFISQLNRRKLAPLGYFLNVSKKIKAIFSMPRKEERYRIVVYDSIP